MAKDAAWHPASELKRKLESLTDYVYYSSKPSKTTFTHLKYLIIFFLIAVGVVPGLVGFLGIYNTSKRELIETKGLYFTEVASFTAFQVEKIIHEKLDTINRLAILPPVHNLLSFPAEPTVKDVENIRKLIMPELARRFFVANIYDKAGEVVFSSEINKESVLRFVKNEIGLDAVNKGMYYVSDILETPAPGELYYIEMFVPVKNLSGELIGSIQAIYEVNKLFSTITGVKIGQTGHANMITSTGNIIVCPIFAPKSHLIVGELLETISKPVPGWTVASDDGHGATGSVVGYSRVNFDLKNLSPASFGEKEWYVFTRQDPEETFKSIKTFQIVAIGYAGMLVMLVIGMGGFALYLILKAQKALQTEVVHKEKAESIKHLISSFHQLIYIPLSEFSAWLEENENRIESSGLEKEQTGKIKQHLLSINSTIQHLAYYAQAETLDFEPTELTPAVKEVLPLLSYIIDKKDIEVHFEPPDETVRVMAHPKLLNIVIMNIVLNAIHAIDNQGIITVHISSKNGWGVVVVSDNGQGIPASEIEYIFDPFFTTKKGHKGYGLGLAVSRGIVEKHDGVINVKSAEDVGTKVIVKLRIAEE